MSLLTCAKEQLLLALLTSIIIIVGGDTEKLSVCGPAPDDSFPSLVFVSTLDGKLSALDLANNGEKKWTVAFDDEPLISSSIHRKELNNDGQWVRLIPSLNGGIYKFDGGNLEKVPITTDQLLRSSFRYSDDLIVSGGLTTHIYKMSYNTGKIYYECKGNRCTNHTVGCSSALLEEDLLLIQRFQQTVIASEPRTGQEKWNYSVGQHELELIPHKNRDCNNNMKEKLEKIKLQVIIPEGIVRAVDKNDELIELWSAKFDTPIVSVWREDISANTDKSKKMRQLNLFDSSQYTWGADCKSSGLYLGMYNLQLYIQEHDDISNLVQLPHHKRVDLIPWQLYPATDNALVVRSKQEEGKNDQVALLSSDEASTAAALSVLYNTENINGHGFYFFVKKQHDCRNENNDTSNKIHVTMENGSESPDLLNGEENEIPFEKLMKFVWNNFGTICTLLVTAIIVKIAVDRPKEGVPTPFIVERYLIEDQSEKIEEFKSHYLAEFETLDYLGKGGYGVVFEVKNKIDELRYAIKRITLPNRRESRDRVMREVKALASLDHPNIVRYYHSWFECPPIGWELTHDKPYIDKSNLSMSEFTNKHSTTTKDAVCIDVPSMDSVIEAMELDPERDDSSSFIVFQDSHDEESAETEEIDESAGSSAVDSGASNECEKYLNDDNNESVQSIVFQNSLQLKKSDSKSEKSLKKPPLRMFLYIQMQLCKKLSLGEWLKHPSHWEDSTRVEKYFQQIVDAVEYIHEKRLIHRDLKPSNIFCAFDGKVKVGDFGLVTGSIGDCYEGCTPHFQCRGIHTACVGTHLYMAPEQKNGQIYDYKVDIYSLGIILFELMRRFGTETERTIVLSDLKRGIFPDDFVAKHAREHKLLKMMLDDDPRKRPTTFGIRARPPLSNAPSPTEDVKWHFELPPISRHTSVTSNSSNESWEHSTAA